MLFAWLHHVDLGMMRELYCGYDDVTLNPGYTTFVMCDVQQAQMSGQNINLVSSICSHISFLNKPNYMHIKKKDTETNREEKKIHKRYRTAGSMAGPSIECAHER